MQKSRPADPGGNPAVPARAGLALVSAAVILFACGCGGSSPSSSAAGATATGGTSANGGGTVTVMARSLPGVGTVLVDSRGYALYMFAPDDHRSVTCTGSCLGTWPPLMLPSGVRLAAGPGVKPMLLGSDPGPAGGRVVTYHGWPLYTYAGDVQPGQATGQDGDVNGGYWYVIRPSGQPEIPAS
jgi:predicted lipoprotein with Yx(FWY)xxD motif